MTPSLIDAAPFRLLSLRIERLYLIRVDTVVGALLSLIVNRGPKSKEAACHVGEVRSPLPCRSFPKGEDLRLKMDPRAELLLSFRTWIDAFLSAS